MSCPVTSQVSCSFASLSNLSTLLQKHPAPICFPHLPFPPAKCYFLTLNKRALLWPGHVQHSSRGTQAQPSAWCAVSRPVKPHQKLRAIQTLSSKTLSEDLSSGFLGHLPLFRDYLCLLLTLLNHGTCYTDGKAKAKNKLSGFPSSCRTALKAEGKRSWAPVPGDIRDQAEQIPTQTGKITADEEEHIHASR